MAYPSYGPVRSYSVGYQNDIGLVRFRVSGVILTILGCSSLILDRGGHYTIYIFTLYKKYFLWELLKGHLKGQSFFYQRLVKNDHSKVRKNPNVKYFFIFIHIKCYFL